MAGEYLRDGLFTMGWFGLMAVVWLGWAQEAPPRRAPLWLGIGSGIGILAALGGGLLVFREWDTPSALDGRYPLFGVLVGAEVVAAGVACLVLWRMGRSRWFAIAVGTVIALHFLPLAWLLNDPSLAVLSGVQLVLVLAASRIADRRTLAPSFTVGAALGSTLLLSAVIAAVRWVPIAIVA